MKKPIFQKDHIYFLKPKERQVEFETTEGGIITSTTPTDPDYFIGIIEQVGQDCKKGFKKGMEVQVPTSSLSKPVKVLGVEYISCNEVMVICSFTNE